jgi:CRISPR type III-A-associated RAMP protein Csm4
MQPGLLIRLRPLGAWRYGPADGGHDRVDTLYRSDRLYSAVTLAMQRLGFLDEWLAATAHAAKPAVVFSSLCSISGRYALRHSASNAVASAPLLLNSPSPVFLTKIRWKTARFVPLSVIDSLITGQPILADQWLPDPESGCLLRRDRPSASPFRIIARSTSAVDRVTNSSDESKSVACIEFEPSAGLWTIARFEDSASEQTWSPRLQSALRLLSDSGFGGGRSKGWGQTQTAEFQPGSWPALLLPKLGRHLATAPVAESSEAAGLFWLLSLYSPAASDKVDWSGGHYSLSARGGRVESHAGHGAAKKTVRMVSEGCVLSSHVEPVGAAVDVAPDGFAHPVYRSGLALALRLPVAPTVEDFPPDTEQPLAEPRTPVSGWSPSPVSPDEEQPPADPAPAVEEPAIAEIIPEEETVTAPVIEEPPAEPEPVPQEPPSGPEPAPQEPPVEPEPAVQEPPHEI